MLLRLPLILLFVASLFSDTKDVFTQIVDLERKPKTSMDEYVKEVKQIKNFIIKNEKSDEQKAYEIFSYAFYHFLNLYDFEFLLKWSEKFLKNRKIKKDISLLYYIQIRIFNSQNNTEMLSKIFKETDKMKQGKLLNSINEIQNWYKTNKGKLNQF
ncbi:MAG TPA: hypothetical protein DC057_12725 [Spirochaetia bacterium]|nr:hypothetical protein [Spirochaetia bacterium]